MSSEEAAGPSVSVKDEESHGHSGGGTAGTRLKSPIDIQELLTKGTLSFEFENAEMGMGAFDDGSDDDMDSDGDEDTRDFLGLDHGADEVKESSEAHNHLASDRILGTVGPGEDDGFFDELVEQMDDVTPDGKVKKLVVQKGGGKAVAADGRVWYNYLAYAEGKANPFDSSFERGVVDTLSLTGNENCIQGVWLALKTMEVGEISKFWIHYDYAYGKMGAPPRIPKAAAILCTIELLEAKEAEEVNGLFNMSPEDRAHVSFPEILDGAEELRAAGNGFYTNENYPAAIKRYKTGVDFLENYITVRQDEEKKRIAALFTLYNNLAQAYLKEGKPSRTSIICQKALKLNLPEHPQKCKLLFRFAEAKHLLGLNEEALSLSGKALACAPGQFRNSILLLIDKVEAAIKEENSAEEVTTMYKKMFVSPGGAGDGSAL